MAGPSRSAGVRRAGDAARPRGTPARSEPAIDVPAGWTLAHRRLTHLAEPYERMVLASYRLGPRRVGDSCAPRSALRRMPPGGALLFVFEYPRNRRDFPAKPRRFRLGRAGDFECFGRGWLWRWTDHGRAFQAHLAAGPRATAARALALHALESLRVAG